eukprot:1280588-Rhodomonas_salina.1
MFAGCSVLEGEGLVLVTAVGSQSNWANVAADVRGHKLVADTTLRMQLDTLASRMMTIGLIVGALFFAVRIAAFAARLSFDSCYDGTMEICKYGYPGLNNHTKCTEMGYQWHKQYKAFSTVDLLKLIDAAAGFAPLSLANADLM